MLTGFGALGFEPLEARRHLSAAADAVPAVSTFEGTITVDQPAVHQFAAKAGERFVFLARSDFDATDIGLDDGDPTTYHADGSYIDHQASVTFLAPRDMSFTVTVQRGLDMFKTSARYELTMEVYPPGYRDPGPDDQTAAVRLPLDTQVSGQFEWPTDHDWYRFDAVAGQEYLVEFDTLELGSHEAGAEIYDAAGNVVAQVSHSDREVAWTAPASGAYFVRVRSRLKAGYTLSARAVDDVGGEPAHATRLRVGDRISGSFDYRSDRDVFVIHALPGRQYVLRADGARIDLVHRDGSLDEGTYLDRDGPVSTFAVRTPGVHYVRVRRPHSGDDDYRLELTTVPNDPAGRPEKPKPIRVNRPIGGEFTTGTDVDLYRLVVKSTRSFVIAHPNTVNPRLRLDILSADGRKVLHEDLAFDARGRVRLDLRRGTYLIRVYTRSDVLDDHYSIVVKRAHVNTAKP